MGKMDCRESKPEAGKAANNGHISLMKSSEALLHGCEEQAQGEFRS